MHERVHLPLPTNSPPHPSTTTITHQTQNVLDPPLPPRHRTTPQKQALHLLPIPLGKPDTHLLRLPRPNAPLPPRHPPHPQRPPPPLHHPLLLHNLHPNLELPPAHHTARTDPCLVGTSSPLPPLHSPPSLPFPIILLPLQSLANSP